MSLTAGDVIRFWTDEVGEANWFKASDEIDATIRDRFMDVWTKASDTGAPPFDGDAYAALASLLVLDQFPRNMFRGHSKSFATDPLARALARRAVSAGWDLEVEIALRGFFYMPFTHSEALDDLETGLAAIERGLGKGTVHRHARAHREIIRRFGRYPYRNEALGRTTTEDEQAFIDDGGYRAVLQDLPA